MEQKSLQAGDVENTTSTLIRWYVLIMMVLVYTLSMADRYVVSTVLDSIKAELHLTDGGVAMLTSWPLALFYVVLGFPISYVLDRHSRRNIVAINGANIFQTQIFKHSLWGHNIFQPLFHAM